MDTEALIRVARQQVKLATRHLDHDGTLAWRINDVEVRVSNRAARTRAGVFHSRGRGDIGYIGMNTYICHTEAAFMSTLLHEFAHAIVAWTMPSLAGRSHGQLWQDVMRHLGQPPTRCIAL